MEPHNWKQDPRLKQMPPEKLDYLTSFAQQVAQLPKDKYVVKEYIDKEGSYGTVKRQTHLPYAAQDNGAGQRQPLKHKAGPDPAVIQNAL